MRGEKVRKNVSRNLQQSFNLSQSRILFTLSAKIYFTCNSTEGSEASSKNSLENTQLNLIVGEKFVVKLKHHKDDLFLTTRGIVYICSKNLLTKKKS